MTHVTYGDFVDRSDPWPSDPLSTVWYVTTIWAIIQLLQLELPN